jgi:DNA-binding CsgD family transcriptional regulator
MPEGKRLTVRLNGTDRLPLIARLLSDIPFTDREMEILRTLLELNTEEITQEVRRKMKERMDISRENLNNMLIRMQAKNIFGRDWRINKTFAPLFGKIDEIVVKLK